MNLDLQTHSLCSPLEPLSMISYDVGKTGWASGVRLSVPSHQIPNGPRTHLSPAGEALVGVAVPGSLLPQDTADAGMQGQRCTYLLGQTLFD